ncbi:MAG: hypothetical protein HC934_07975 [Acaryochloridaceae cyanobacterium SU_2_1]|nr:hypothetical protein [Acaryochloridaceae cyanobacterium SU_2_1]
MALATLAAQDQPLPADWALAELMFTNDFKLNTSMLRCFPEWRALFRHYYGQQFGPGLRPTAIADQGLPPTVFYQPASVSFGGAFELSLPNIPRAKLAEDLVSQLTPLLEGCTQELKSYSRWLTRNPRGQGSYGAILLLPPALAQSFESPEVQSFRAWVQGCLQDQAWVVMSGRELLDHWQTESTTKLTKTEATSLAQYLRRLGVGIEPDVYFGGKPLEADSALVLFALTEGDSTPPSTTFTLAMLLLHLSMLVATADGEVTPQELERLESYLVSTTHLLAGERLRLQAHLQGLLHSKLSFRGLKSKLQTLEEARKSAIASFLVHLAGIDGEINPSEITILKKLYALLDLEEQTLSHHLQEITGKANLSAPSLPQSDPDPQPRLGSSRPPQYLQPQPTGPTLAFGLNLDLVNVKMTESATASTLLANVFEATVVEAEEPDNNPQDHSQLQATTPQATQPLEPGLAGLDAAHTQLLQLLVQQPEWPRPELVAQVLDSGLLLDGALEILNEVAFECCEEALTEGDDPIEVNLEVGQQLLS